MTRALHQTKPLGAAVLTGLVLLSLFGWPTPNPARAEGISAKKEYEVKAALILNFIQFIQWPEAAFPNPNTPITVGILGDDPFGETLEKTFNDESVQNRKLVIKRSAQVEELKSCHLLFISKSEKEHLPEILAALKDTPVATVGDTDKFAERGGIINFYLDNKKIRFEINDEAAQHKGLKISSQLLKRAKIVGSEQGKGGE